MDVDQTNPHSSPSHIRAHWLTYTIALVMIVIIAALGYLLYQRQQLAAGTQHAATNSTVATTTADTGPVASVNGHEISRARFNVSLAQSIHVAVQQGLDTNDQTVQQQLVASSLTTVVNTEVLLQAAEAAGITISSTTVEQRLSAVKAQYASDAEYQTALATYLLTEPMLRELLWEQEMMNAYIARAIDLSAITVSSSEIDSVVAIAKSSTTVTFPPDDQLRPYVENQILVRKQQNAIANLIQSLSDQDDIQILI